MASQFEEKGLTFRTVNDAREDFYLHIIIEKKVNNIVLNRKWVS